MTRHGNNPQTRIKVDTLGPVNMGVVSNKSLSFPLVCFVSVELIEVKTELAGDTLDGIRDDEMNVALNNIFQSKYDPHQVIKSVKMQFISLNL